MTTEKIKNEVSLTKGVFLAYFILILHVFLIAGLGVIVILFQGFVNYLNWIFLGGAVLLMISGFYFYRKIRAQGRSLKEALNSPVFQGRSIEVSLLGGLASLKVGGTGNLPALDNRIVDPSRQLEDPNVLRARELTELARLFEKELITREEFDTAKRRLFKN